MPSNDIATLRTLQLRRDGRFGTPTTSSGDRRGDVARLIALSEKHPLPSLSDSQLRNLADMLEAFFAEAKTG